MVKQNLSDVENLIVPIIENLGIEFVDVTLEKQMGNLTLTVFIDKTGGVMLTDCELVSKAIDAPLDGIDFTNGKSYNLNVSSPGLDRPLIKEVDFRRNLNQEIEVKFYKSFLNSKTLKGELVGYEEKEFTIKVNNELIKINKNLVAKAAPIIKF